MLMYMDVKLMKKPLKLFKGKKNCQFKLIVDKESNLIEQARAEILFKSGKSSEKIILIKLNLLIFLHNLNQDFILYCECRAKPNGSKA